MSRIRPMRLSIRETLLARGTARGRKVAGGLLAEIAKDLPAPSPGRRLLEAAGDMLTIASDQVMRKPRRGSRIKGAR